MKDFLTPTFCLNAMFVLALATVAGGALIAALSRRLIHSVCGLAICCLGLSGLYYFLHSPFVAMMEILIYIGAVCVTVVFAVMLVEPDEPRERRLPALEWTGIVLVIIAGLFWALSRLVLHATWAQPGEIPKEKWAVEAIGEQLLTTYSMAFELISLALLVAIIGALAIARTGRTKP